MHLVVGRLQRWDAALSAAPCPRVQWGTSAAHFVQGEACGPRPQRFNDRRPGKSRGSSSSAVASQLTSAAMRITPRLVLPLLAAVAVAASTVGLVGAHRGGHEAEGYAREACKIGTPPAPGPQPSTTWNYFLSPPESKPSSEERTAAAAASLSRRAADGAARAAARDDRYVELSHAFTALADEWAWAASVYLPDQDPVSPSVVSEHQDRATNAERIIRQECAILMAE